jgi:hypothetical protein
MVVEYIVVVEGFHASSAIERVVLLLFCVLIFNLISIFHSLNYSFPAKQTALLPLGFEHFFSGVTNSRFEIN